MDHKMKPGHYFQNKIYNVATYLVNATNIACEVHTVKFKQYSF